MTRKDMKTTHLHNLSPYSPFLAFETRKQKNAQVADSNNSNLDAAIKMSDAMNSISLSKLNELSLPIVQGRVNREL